MKGMTSMDVRSLRSLMEINSLQTLGSVSSYSKFSGSSDMFQMLLANLTSNSSLTNTLSSASESMLGSTLNKDALEYTGSRRVYVPPYVSAAAQMQQSGSAPSSAGQKVTADSKYSGFIKQASQHYNVPEKLIAAVIQQESNFNNNVVSHAGAQGLMQLMPGTAKFLGVADSFDPFQNIMGGAKYLRQMLNQFGGDTELALAAYNAGPGNVKKYNGVPPFKETQQYVKKVLGYLQG